MRATTPRTGLGAADTRQVVLLLPPQAARLIDVFREASKTSRTCVSVPGESLQKALVQVLDKKATLFEAEGLAQAVSKMMTLLDRDGIRALVFSKGKSRAATSDEWQLAAALSAAQNCSYLAAARAAGQFGVGRFGAFLSALFDVAARAKALGLRLEVLSTNPLEGKRVASDLPNYESDFGEAAHRSFDGRLAGFPKLVAG